MKLPAISEIRIGIIGLGYVGLPLAAYMAQHFPVIGFDINADRPDAVFVGSDQMAMAVMDVLRTELGLRIPDDVSVVGFDNVPQAAWGAYQLTSVEQPIEQMIEVAATLLFEQLNESAHKVLPHTVVVPCRLVVRATSRSES